ncbi:MAG: DUF393 domain-containing protein [Verrucomicrobiae bacterium]|nr:DUF393 domain-containing protein [Verrucomicrobiae bacterium]
MAQHLLIYDGHCAFCTRMVRLLQQLDWLHHLHCLPAHAALSLAQTRGISPAHLQQALHCLAADGRVLAGAAALRFIALRLPLLCLPALLLFLPGALPLAERAYRAVAARRHCLGGSDCAHDPPE